MVASRKMTRAGGLAAIIVVDAQRRRAARSRWVSPGFELLTGYSASEVVGRNPRLLQGPDTDPRAISLLTEAVAAGRDAYVTLLNYRADGTPFWNEVAIAPQHDAESGRIVRWLGDAARRHRPDARHRAPARAGVLRRADRPGQPRRAARRAALRDAPRARPGAEIALLRIDLDDFRRVNDKWGHEAGDALLRVAADRLRR